jgi:BMFP domain-containing protein YqiC
MSDKSNSLNLDELARQLAGAVPQNLKVLGEDLQQNFRSLLQSALQKMDLVTREEFDVQRALLERTRERLEVLEARLQALEQESAGPD